MLSEENASKGNTMTFRTNLMAVALLLGLSAVLRISAQATSRGQSHASDHEIVKPCDDCIPGVINFGKISQTLWRGAQPTAEGFRNLEKAGVKTVVSFRHDNGDLPLLKGTKLKYLRIPSRAFHPKAKNLARFLKVMEDPANGPVFIHCAEGRDRTGYNAAAYRMVFQGWDAESALKEMETFRFNKVWVLNPGYIRRLDVEKLKRMTKELPKPVFQ